MNSFDALAGTPAQHKSESRLTVLLRPLRSEDLSAIVQVHLNSFPNSFLTFLGPGFLKLLYRNIARERVLTQSHPEDTWQATYQEYKLLLDESGI